MSQRLLDVLLLRDQLLRILLVLLLLRWKVENLNLLDFRVGIERYRGGRWVVQAQRRSESSWHCFMKKGRRAPVGHLRHQLSELPQFRVLGEDLSLVLGFLQREHRPRVSWSRLRPISLSRPWSQSVKFESESQVRGMGKKTEAQEGRTHHNLFVSKKRMATKGHTSNVQSPAKSVNRQQQNKSCTIQKLT
jgi:hypothetical protein